MRAHEFLIESEGGIIRRGQEVAQGKVVTFAKGDDQLNLTKTVVIPEVELRYETAEELEQALSDTIASLGNPKVLYYSPVGPKSGAALITLWKDATDSAVAFVKFANSKKTGAFPITWTNADFGRDTGYQQTNNKIAERAQFKLKPNELFPVDQDIPIIGLSKQIKVRDDLPQGVAEQLRQLLINVETGNKNPVPGADKYVTTYEVDFGESAAPIALVTGNFVSGSYREAEDALLKPIGLSWTGIKSVLFPGGGSNLLYDSYLRLDKGNTLKVSSKDKKGGAAAAVTGLVKDITENPARFKDITDKEEYQEILEILKTVAANSAVSGPLALAQSDQIGIIDAADASTILNLFGKGQKYAPDAKWAQTPGIKAALARKGAKFQDPAYDMGFHLLAGVAELVADKLNGMPGMSDFFKAVLERSTMIQVKAKMQTSGNGASFTNFEVIYPPVFDGIIKVVASNNYMATRKPIGKISFKIP
jgi:hypothetical protein